MKAWWFNDGGAIRFGDERVARLGVTNKVDGPIIPGKNGLHASERAIDALTNATGTVVWRVELGGTIVHGGNHFAASERTYLAGGIDVSDILQRFARMCALDVIHLWDAPEIVIRFLKTGDESIRATALGTAKADASDASFSAMAAWSAACAAARGARAVKNAARAAARAAAMATAREMQNTRLEEMLMAAIRQHNGGGD